MNPFNDIRAEDIERVEVMKGASATTLYGTEASGGVIQIFTKRGRAGRPQWTLEVVGGTNDLDYLDIPGDETAVFLKECRGANMFGIDITPTNATYGQNIPFEDSTCPSSNKWISTGAIQRYSASVGGGSELMQYFMTANYSDEEGAVDPGAFKTGGFRGNFSFRPLQQLDLSLNSSYQRGDQQWIPDGNLANGFLLNVARGTAGNYRGSGMLERDVTLHEQRGRAHDRDELPHRPLHLGLRDQLCTGRRVDEPHLHRLRLQQRRAIAPSSRSVTCGLPLASSRERDWNRKFLSHRPRVVVSQGLRQRVGFDDVGRRTAVPGQPVPDERDGDGVLGTRRAGADERRRPDGRHGHAAARRERGAVRAGAARLARPRVPDVRPAGRRQQRVR